MSNPNLYVGFSQGEGFVPEAIQVFTGKGVNHAFLCWEDAHLGWEALGANSNGVTPDVWSNFVKSRYVPAIFRPRDGLPTLWEGLEKLKAKLNEEYDFRGLLSMSIVELARHYGKEIPNPGATPGKTFCSQFTMDIIRAAGFVLLADRLSSTIDPHEEMHAIASDPDFVQEAPPK